MGACITAELDTGKTAIFVDQNLTIGAASIQRLPTKQFLFVRNRTEQNNASHDS